MDVKDYCETVGKEPAAWKAKMNEVTKKTNALTGVDRENAEPIVKDLTAIMDDIDQRIAVLARECPAEWSAEKTEIEGNISRMNDRWKEIWGVMGEEPEYGIGGA